MVTQRVSADIKWIVVGSPDYFAKHGHPTTPHDLAHHQCFQTKLGNDRIYRWEFAEDGVDFAVDAPGKVTIDSTVVAIRLALGGAGLMYAPEPAVREDIADGRLVETLAAWAPMGEALHVYYSSLRQVPLGLRLLIDLIREIRPLGL